MKQQALKERMELLEIAEVLGYPRMGFGQSNGHKWSIRAGQPNWEKFCSVGHTTRLATVLRNARILRDNGVVPYNPRTVTVEIRNTGVDAGYAMPPEIKDSVFNQVITRRVDLLDEIEDPPSVTPVRSAAALRQQRFRDRKRSKT